MNYIFIYWNSAIFQETRLSNVRIATLMSEYCIFIGLKRYSMGTHPSSYCWQMKRVPFVAFSATNGPPYGADVLLLVDRGESELWNPGGRSQSSIRIVGKYVVYHKIP